MMYIPSVFNENLLDDFFDGANLFGYVPVSRKMSTEFMKTDIKEHENHYEMQIDLPGFKKEDLKLQLNNGYLTISASHDENKDEKNKDGKVVRQERYSGSMQRSFYVGDNLKQEDISAKFENGVLMLDVPKKAPEKEVSETKYIEVK